MLAVTGSIAVWVLVTQVAAIPSYKLPPPQMVGQVGWHLLTSGQLSANAWVSFWRLILAFAIGAGLAIPLGLGIATNRYVASFLRPLVTFFNSVAGIAWIPLAIIWFGFGPSAVIFVVANNVFFIVLFNTVTGALTIPQHLIRAVRTLGGGPRDVFWHVILPGALVNILGGLRTGMAFGWRALVVAEIVGSSGTGLGYMILNAARYFDTATMLVGIFAVGVVWLFMDRLLLKPWEMRTVERWGLTQP
ncbi:MAG TPA: ABC transporter permease [bacterium]|nr:ABC transporter permease [bacterium]